MGTLREKLIKLEIKDVFVNKLEAELNLMREQSDHINGLGGLTVEQYKQHIEDCRKLAWQILTKLDK